MDEIELMDSEKARSFLIEAVEKDKRHQDYDHVVKLADTYYALITGDGLDEMMERIVTRESEEMFDQRKTITKHIIPAVLNPTKLPYTKATRKQPIVRKIDYESNEEKTEKALVSRYRHPGSRVYVSGKPDNGRS